MPVAEMTEAPFRELFDSVSNWGGWHNDHHMTMLTDVDIGLA